LQQIDFIYLLHSFINPLTDDAQNLLATCKNKFAIFAHFLDFV